MLVRCYHHDIVLTISFQQPEQKAEREANDAKKKREERLKEIQDLRAKGILGE